MHKNLLIALVILVVSGALLLLAQIWTSFMPWDVFVKALITMAVLVIVLAFLLVVGVDLGQHKKLKDENYLD